MTILKATIVRLHHGCDHVNLETDLPDAVYPFTENLTLHFQAARETGEMYMCQHLPAVPFTVVIDRQPKEETT